MNPQSIYSLLDHFFNDFFYQYFSLNFTMDSVGSSKLFPFSWTSTYRSSVRKTRLLINIFSASVTGKKKRRSTFWLIIDPGEEPHRRTQGEKKGKQKKNNEKKKEQHERNGVAKWSTNIWMRGARIDGPTRSP